MVKIRINNVKCNSDSGWTYDILAVKKVNVNGKWIKIKLKENVIAKWVNYCEMQISKVILTPEELDALRKEALSFVKEVNSVCKVAEKPE